MKKYKKLIFKTLISIVLFYLISLRVDGRVLVQSFSLINIRFAPLIVAFLILNYVVSSLRWKSLLVHREAQGVSVKYLTSLYFIGAFFNNFMPTSIGGDVYKVLQLGKRIGNRIHAFSATFMERFTGVVVLALIGIFGMTKFIGVWVVGAFALFIVSLFVGLKVLAFLSTKIKKLEGIYASLCEYKGRKDILVWALVTSIVVQLLAISAQYFVFMALGIELPVLYALMVFPAITLASFFVPSLNGIGVQDALYMNLFVSVGVGPEVALSASILYHLFRLGVSLIGGLLYAMGKDA